MFSAIQSAEDGNRSSHDGILTFTCEHWSLHYNNHQPTLEAKQVISVKENASKWLLYVADLRERSQWKYEARAAPAAFSVDCHVLRIGTQLFIQDKERGYLPLQECNSKHGQPFAYVEEFASRGSYTAIATRRQVTVSDIRRINDAEDSNSVDLSSSDSEFDAEDYAYESFSEGDTECSDDLDDTFAPWRCDHTSLTTDKVNEEKDSSDSDVDDPQIQEDYSDSGSDGDRDDDEQSSDESTYSASPSSSKALISLYSSSSTTGETRRCFHFTRAQAAPGVLYNSPPVFHPSESLVVWPLGEGSILFADFLQKTYFIRELRSSISHSKSDYISCYTNTYRTTAAHICIKCHFSACGRYLHMASLERQKLASESRKVNADLMTSQANELKLLVLTYRLSESKTTRSPPSLVHRARVDLGLRTLKASKLPFTFTWTPAQVHLTCSENQLENKRANQLEVYRVSLFGPSSTLAHPVLVPQEPIVLPRTDRMRQVHYFSSTSLDTPARIIISNEPNRTEGGAVASSPGTRNVVWLEGAPLPLGWPIGCFIRDVDFGGWKPSACSDLPRDLGVGQLVRCREKFDFDEDCDCELCSELS